MWERLAFPLSMLLLLESAWQNVTLSGAECVFNSFLQSFTEDFLAVAQTTEATSALDATVGGTLARVVPRLRSAMVRTVYTRHVFEQLHLSHSRLGIALLKERQRKVNKTVCRRGVVERSSCLVPRT